jgi:hypothetical protein
MIPVFHKQIEGKEGIYSKMSFDIFLYKNIKYDVHN